MDMNKEKWVNEVINSLDDVRSAEASPFLYTRILSRLEKGATSHAPTRLVWLAAATFLILLALNTLSVIKSNSETTTRISDAQLVADAYQLTNSNTFSYN